MKIRINGNSVRYRLTKTEVETFCKTGVYQETTHFLDQTFVYELKADKNIDALQANFVGGAITLYLPAEELNVWATSDKVGYKNIIQAGNGEELSLLLEKDFVCLDEVEEDQSDNYPNPAALKK